MIGLQLVCRLVVGEIAMTGGLVIRELHRVLRLAGKSMDLLRREHPAALQADKRYKLAFLTTGKYQYVNKTKIAGNLSRSGLLWSRSGLARNRKNTRIGRRTTQGATANSASFPSIVRLPDRPPGPSPIAAVRSPRRAGGDSGVPRTIPRKTRELGQARDQGHEQ